jgi:hypothetical protein
MKKIIFISILSLYSSLILRAQGKEQAPPTTPNPMRQVVEMFNAHLIRTTGADTATVYEVAINDYPKAKTVTFTYKIPNVADRGTVMYIIAK